MNKLLAVSVIGLAGLLNALSGFAADSTSGPTRTLQSAQAAMTPSDQQITATTARHMIMQSSDQDKDEDQNIGSQCAFVLN